MTCGGLGARLGGAVLAATLATPLSAQAPRPPDLFVTRLQGSGGSASAAPGGGQRPAVLQPLPVTQLDDRPPAADLDGPRRISIAIARPMPLRDLLLLLVSGTPLSLVNDESVDGTFVGDLKDLTMRQALEAVLFPRGLDYDVQGTLIRVFPRKASTRLFNVNYLNVRRSWRRGVLSTVAVDGRRVPAAELSSSSEADPFDELGRGVQALLSTSGRMHLDRVAGLVQVTDFSDRLDQVGVYIEAVQLRATRQVRIEARVFEVAFAGGGASSVDWKAVAARSGAAPRATPGLPAAGLAVAEVDALTRAIAEQGAVTMMAAPHVVTMNNEPAVMRVGTQAVYFESATSIAPDGADERATRPAVAFEGLTLTVLAQISADGIVQLQVAPSYAARAGQSKSAAGDAVPVLRVSEADTTVRVRDGETLVLSGFLEERERSKPATGFAAMFGAQPRERVKSELVILLTPTIVSPGAPAAAAR